MARKVHAFDFATGQRVLVDQDELLLGTRFANTLGRTMVNVVRQDAASYLAMPYGFAATCDDFAAFDEGNSSAYFEESDRISNHSPFVWDQWNAADKRDASLVLSNSNRTATKSTASAGYWLGRAVTGKSSENVIFEGTFTGTVGVAESSIGLANSSQNLASYLGNSVNGWAFMGQRKAHNGSIVSSGVTYTAGDIVSVIWKALTGELWFAKNGTVIGGGDPVAGTSPSYTGVTGTLFPCVCIFYNTSSFTATFGPLTYNWTGFTGWAVSGGDPGSMSLRTIAFDAPSAPSDVSLIARYDQPDNNVSLNTDVVFSVSRDNGTTFTASTLSVVESIGTERIVQGVVDVSAQPSGTEIIVKVTTPSSEKFELIDLQSLWA